MDREKFAVRDGVLLEYSGQERQVEIPGGVTEIGRNVFRNCRELREAVIPDGVVKIGSFAFEDSGLEKITFPAGLEVIEDNAFRKTHLRQVVLPAGLKEIGFKAFSRIPDLRQVHIPASVQTIWHGCFQGCDNLGEFDVAADNPWFSGDGWMLFNKDRTKLHSAPAGEMDLLEIPDGVREIGARALFGDEMEAVDLPDSLTRIGAWAFAYCRDLERISLPAHLEEIGAHAFCACSGLREVFLPQSVTRVSPTAFEETEAALCAPWLPISAFPAACKLQAICGFLSAEGRELEMPAEIRAGYVKYIRTQRRKLYPLAVEDRRLLHLMLRERMMDGKDLDEMLEALEKAEALDVPLKAWMMDERNRLQTPGQRARQMKRSLDLLESGSLSVTEARRSWRFEVAEDGVRILGYKGIKQDVVVPERRWWGLKRSPFRPGASRRRRRRRAGGLPPSRFRRASRRLRSAPLPGETL